MNRRGGGGRAGPSNLPIPTYSRGSPANSTTSSQGGRGRASLTHSAEDIPRQFGSSMSPVGLTGRAPSPGARRAPSPGDTRRRSSLMSPIRPPSQAGAPQQMGVRYITEDLIRKVAKEDNLDLITSLNLTLTKESGKKIKYIENLDRLRKVQTLNLSFNVIERMERLDKLLKLRDLNLSNNMLTRIEGIENLTSLQSLNLNDNQIEHIPPWFSKKLKALRTFRIARNNLASLNEISKLKPLPDLIQLDVADNPLSDLSHCRLYVVFHLRTVEILDGQSVHDQERKHAQDRFALGEVEQLEKRLEQEEMKYKQLEESHSKSLQERSLQESSQTQLMSKERSLQEQLKRTEQELSAKDELLKKKTSDLNKASQKHYQLEQELAFYKIDSKFDSLSEAPKFQVENADSSGDLQESPYIGRARFKANQFAQETSLGIGSPQRAQVLSARASPGIVRRSLSPPSKDRMHTALDAELERKHTEVQKTEEKLKLLQDDLSATEKKLMSATTELKKISTDRITPEPFRDDNKFKIRQRLARKMQKVNELRDMATQMESEIDRKHEKITADRSELHKMQNHLAEMDTNSFGFGKRQKEMLDKESQINESSHKQIELQKELEEALANIAKETSDIKKLEEHLSAEQIEQNDELRHELDDIVTGLSGYLENVKGQSRQHKQEFELLIQEKEGLEEKIRRMEEELQILEGEASNARWMQKRLSELEDSLRKTEDLNTTLQDEVRRSRDKDPEVQGRLHRAEEEAKHLRQTLMETEKKTEAEKKNMQKQLQTERERAEKMTQRIQDVNRQELEAKKLLSQLEAAKALNAGLRDQIEEFKHKQQMEEGGFKPSDLKKRLKKFTHEFKTNKNPIEPQGKNDILGMTFQDLQKHTQDLVNNSSKEISDLRKSKEKTEAEIQTLKDKLKKTETSSKKEQTKEEKRMGDENKRLQEETKRLKKLLEEAKTRNKEGAIPVRIVYRPDSENSMDRASSLNSDEKRLFDELQRELLDLKRNMRQQEDDISKKLAEAETEAAHWKEEVKQKHKEYEAEMEEHRQAAELMREKQEARIQVIAQDLDQAQFVADSLQHMLEERERVLNEEMNNADMSNQMMSAQEDELARLYDILETQRDEIENLNQILDHLAQQGPDGVGAGFDDELWRIRQEVNNLKETLAMQSAYVQAMPGVGHMSTQADGFFPSGVPSGPAGGSTVRGSGAAAGTQVGGGRQYGSAPTLPSKVSGSQANTTATVAHRSHSSGQSGGMARPGSMQMAGAAMASTPMPRSAQSSGLAGEPRVPPVEHLGTERRESKAPHGSRSAVGKSGDGLPSQSASRTQDRAFDGNATAQQANGRTSRRSSRSRAPRATVPSAFEPVHRPEPYHPYQSPPPHPATVPVPTPAMYPAGPPVGAPLPQPSYPLPHQGGPARASQTSGVQGSSRGVQVGADPSGFMGPVFYPGGVDGYARGVAPPMGAMPTGGGGDPAVAFNPVPLEISYNPGSALHGFDGSAGGGYSVGSQTYLPSGPAQVSHYGPGRVYMPAGAGHQGQHPARIYYPAHRSIPMPAPGGAPPPPPPGGGSMTPVAAGTPIKGGGPPVGFYDGSFIMGPPSPIRAASMDVHPRGILKNAGVEPSGTDDSYLFCNVPEHHDLEDYIAELQEKIRKLKLRFSKEKDFYEESIVYEDRKTVKRLLTDLEDRRDELEGLDLAIERQKRNLREMKQEEKDLKRDRRDALGELEHLRRRNDRKLLAKRRKADDDSFDEEMERNRQKYLKDELECLEKTLAKRQAQLKETERNLKECNADLKDAKEQARDTVKRYDDATSNLHQALREQQEIDKRSNDTGIELVKAMEQLEALKTDVRDLERRKSKQEKLLREINNIISKKDSEFKDLDAKVKTTSQSLQRLEADLAVHTQREKDMVEALRDSEDVLGKRRGEIQRMRDQSNKVKAAITQKVDQNRQELEKLDQEMGRKRTELQFLQETQERKQQDLNNVLQDAEADIASKHREIKDCRDELDQLDHQKADLTAHIKTKRTELQKLKEEIEQEEEVLQRLSSNVNKNKSELKHTFEMQKIEQTELENVKAQHTQKLMELERTQRSLLEEKGDLEQLNAETARKSADLERLRQAIDRDRLEVDQLNAEKQNLDDRIATLTRERDMLDENCKALDDKLNNMKRNHRIMEEKLESTTSRVEMLEAELRMREREMEEAELQKEAMQKDIQSLKQNIKESKTELKTLQDSIREAQDQMRGIDQDVRNTFHQRDEAKQELERLNEQIRQSSSTCDDHSRQEKAKYRELQDLLRSLAEREKEQQEARMALNKIRKEVEKEENRLNRLVSNANSDLETVRIELTEKQDELEAMRKEYTELQKKSEELQYNEEKCAELSKTCRDLEQDLQDRNDEKTELAKALSASYEEVQRLRKETVQIQEKMAKERAELENSLKDLQVNLEQSKQETIQVENRSSSQVSELQSLAEKHFNRANCLEAELTRVKKEVLMAKKQLVSQEVLSLRLDAMSDALNWSGEEIDTARQQHHQLQLQLQQSQLQDLNQTVGSSEDIDMSEDSDKLSDDKENTTVTEVRIVPVPVKEYDWKKDALRERIAEEQDYLRFQLRQQMLRHSQTMESARIKSEETIDCLRRKLNTLQEVLFNTNPDMRAIQELTRTRSRSGSPHHRLDARYCRTRSPSPLNRSGLRSPRRSPRRSRSTESLGSPIIPTRDFL